ncbi:uncharacterized protein N7482_008884 [Penicillium canariense]|uniref:Uncharacterized protein n=1 Tax=Penicillium canariense TaxID=189055 RepID=A0A9W9LIS5_9EURO|nr:uncharacterized protein N7482_008884 [Penicillium canariense]KAJ5157784.1 hypothetical protein N7482_008884 [Penicillium canariense]
MRQAFNEMPWEYHQVASHDATQVSQVSFNNVTSGSLPSQVGLAGSPSNYNGLVDRETYAQEPNPHRPRKTRKV